MHPTNRKLRFGGALVLLGMSIGGAALTAQEPAPPPRPAALPPVRTATGAIIVPIGVSQALPMSTRKAITAVRLNVEGIVRVSPNAIDPTSVILTGLASGTARLFLTDVDNKEESYDIIVQLDVSYLKRQIAEAVPTANVDVRPVLNRAIILTGWVADAKDVDVIKKIATAVVGGQANIVDAMQVGGVTQVQLDVTVARVNRTEARRRGFAFAYNGNAVSFGSIMSGLVTAAPGTAAPAAGVGVLTGQAALNPSADANIVFGIVNANVQMLLQALRTESLATLLAEPKIVTLSGRPAHILSGGQQAILSPSGGLGGPGVAYRDVGTELDFLPIVLGNGRIYLEVNPTIRAVNNGRGITTAFGFVPGFDEQSAKTAIELEPGQTMAIGGLIQTENAADSTRIPVLGDLPYVGTLFSRVQHTTEEQEMVILVTPHLVDGMDCKQAPKHLPGRETRAPDDYELFLEGILEAPRGQRQVFENGKYKAAYKNDPSYERFPCADPLPKEPRQKRSGGYAAPEMNCAPAAAPALAPRMAPPIGPAVMPNPVAAPGPGFTAGDGRNYAAPADTIPGVPSPLVGQATTDPTPRAVTPTTPAMSHPVLSGPVMTGPLPSNGTGGEPPVTVAPVRAASSPRKAAPVIPPPADDEK
jgi:pilus assembly protein CpaC